MKYYRNWIMNSEINNCLKNLNAYRQKTYNINDKL